jgi:hypothetical protein
VYGQRLEPHRGNPRPESSVEAPAPEVRHGPGI